MKSELLNSIHNQAFQNEIEKIAKEDKKKSNLLKQIAGSAIGATGGVIGGAGAGFLAGIPIGAAASAINDSGVRGGVFKSFGKRPTNKAALAGVGASSLSILGGAALGGALGAYKGTKLFEKKASDDDKTIRTLKAVGGGAVGTLAGGIGGTVLGAGIGLPLGNLAYNSVLNDVLKKSRKVRGRIKVRSARPMFGRGPKPGLAGLATLAGSTVLGTGLGAIGGGIGGSIIGARSK